MRFYSDYQDRIKDMLSQMEVALYGLGDEALNWVPGEEMNSIGVLVVHAVAATRFWIGDMALGDLSSRVRAEEFDVESTGADELLEKIGSLREYIAARMPELEAVSLQELRYSEVHDREFSIGWSLLHALEHLAMHVGHVQLTRQFYFQKYLGENNG
jgi:hypothetical protein